MLAELLTALPAGFQMRPPTWEDATAIAELITAVDISMSNESDFSANELLVGWERAGFNLETDAWMVTAPGENGDEIVVGYEELWNRARHARLEGDGYVHPNYTGRGIGTVLLRLLERRARQHIPLAPAGVRVFVRNGLEANDRAARQLHENEGYQPVRYFWKMQVDLDSPPAEPAWPEGIRLAPFDPVQDARRVHAASTEAFRDHWGHWPRQFEDWERYHLLKGDHDPGLWFIAMDGEEIAGVSLCKEIGERGWVGSLGVRKPWRKQGLGQALLLHSFGEFYRRGLKIIGLSVDASNTTGATRLYERVGMRVVHEFVAYEKELRPGKDLALE